MRERNRKFIQILFLIFVLLILPITPSHSSTTTPIKHVIFIIEENHSFDNLFGTYPFGYPPIINNITLSLMRPYGLYTSPEQLNKPTLNYISVPNVPFLPFLGVSHPYYADAYSTVNPYEGWSAYHGDYWFGKPMGFVYYSGPQSMAFFSYQQAFILWDYAEEYVLADNFFAPVMGLTEPNRIAYLIGNPPPFYSDEASDIVPFNQSIMYQLSEYNISWAYFVYDFSGGIPWPLNAFIGYNGQNSYDLSVFFKDLKDGKLPAVSWVMFLGGNSDRYDIHPPYNITKGEIMLVKVINAVMESPYWNSTVIFITMDEGGGYYDQVVPPAINHYGLGQRIPLLIISPYAKEGWINNYTISGYTLLAFIDYNWHLPYLTKTVADSDVYGLLQSFNFSTNPRPPIILTQNNWSYPLPLQYPIHYGYIAKVPDYEGYNFVYPAPALYYLLPIEVIGALAFAFGLKVKKFLAVSAIIFLATVSIAGYYNYTNNIYSFITNFYLYTSVIGFLASAGLGVKVWKAKR